MKEVRQGKHSREFDKWSEECKRVEPKTCFIILYGKSFNLKSLSVAGKFLRS